MKYLKHRVLAGETLLGVFVNLGSPLTAEIVGSAGFDWTLIDLEHGAGDEKDVLSQIQALESTPAVPLVRIESGNRPRFHRVLDFGASGIMVPRVDSSEQADEVVACMHYPPAGIRGVASMNRSCGFGASFSEYIRTAEEKLLCIVQIESMIAVKNAARIAAVKGVDVLFVGPLDLSYSMGMVGQFESSQFIEALTIVADAARVAGKTAGILLKSPQDAARLRKMGYTFLGCGSDGGLLHGAARLHIEALRESVTKTAVGPALT